MKIRRDALNRAETLRGKHPSDEKLFSKEALKAVRSAAADLRYLLNHGYAQPSSIKLVGDRFNLRKRQRQLLQRAISSLEDVRSIDAKRTSPELLKNSTLLIDGHNVLITIETALAGGLLLRCDDGLVRDLAEVHGSYRYTDQTKVAIGLLHDSLEMLSPGEIFLTLDRPMPFSGELAEKLREKLGVHVDVADSADGAIRARLISSQDAIVASADSGLLRHATHLFDLSAYTVRCAIPGAWIVQSRDSP